MVVAINIVNGSNQMIFVGGGAVVMVENLRFHPGKNVGTLFIADNH